nr:hypothetical protein [Candidatus Freyrarchaeum guaymaensis]
SIVNHFGIPFGVVVNRFDAYPEMSSEISRLIEDLGGEVLALIPSDEEVVHAIVGGQPVVERAPSSPASRALKEAFERIEKLLER